MALPFAIDRLPAISALLYENAGRYAEAEPLYRQALAIRKQALGEGHPDYATSLNDLAGLLYAQGDYPAARPLIERALAIQPLPRLHGVFTSVDA